MSTRNVTRDSGSFAGPAQRDTSLLGQLRSKMANICQDSRGNIVAMACHECGANAAITPGVKDYFNLKGLRQHYRLAHACLLDAELAYRICKKTTLTSQDIQDILNDKAPSNPELKLNKTRAKRRPDTIPANTNNSHILSAWNFLRTATTPEMTLARLQRLRYQTATVHCPSAWAGLATAPAFRQPLHHSSCLLCTSTPSPSTPRASARLLLEMLRRKTRSQSSGPGSASSIEREKQSSLYR